MKTNITLIDPKDGSHKTYTVYIEVDKIVPLIASIAMKENDNSSEFHNLIRAQRIK
jgi:hypothetical protein